MAMLQAVRDWQGPRPSALGLCAEADDLTYMLALYRTEGRMRQWERQVAEEEAKKRAH